MDFLHNQKNAQEINAAPVQENGFFAEQAKSLEEQKQRFEEAKLAKKGKKKGEAPGKAPVNEQHREADLDAVKQEVQKNMPPKFADRVAENKIENKVENKAENKVENKAQNKAEKKQQKKTPLPAEMAALLDEVLTWRKVKADTSIPVKNAADVLKKAKTDDEAAVAMAMLSEACNNYVQRNRGKLYKDTRRKEVVNTLITQLSGFQTALLQKEEAQNVLLWNGKEVKESVFQELKMSVGSMERPLDDRTTPERFEEVFGKDALIPGSFDENVINRPEEGLNDDEAGKVRLCRHLAAEKEKLLSRRSTIRNAAKTRISQKQIEEMSRLFHTEEEKEALREWIISKNRYGEDVCHSMIADEKSGMAMPIYSGIIREVQKASIDDFLDGDEGEFASSFAEKYDRLCKYASAAAILKIAEKIADAEGGSLSNSKDFSVNETKAKIKFFTEMKEHYEDRMRLMSSPFYIDKKNEEMAKYLGKDAEKEKEKVTDPKLLEYITLYQKVFGSSLAIGKGRETKDHYNAILDVFQNEQMKKDEETVKIVQSKIKAGEAAEKAYYKDHEREGLVLDKEDEDAPAKELLKLRYQQRALAISSFPKDDMEFLKNHTVSCGAELIMGMGDEEIISLEKIITEDILSKGMVGGKAIEPALLSEVKELIRDFVAARREYMAEYQAHDFVCARANGYDIDINNPKNEQSATIRSIKKYLRTEKVPSVFQDSFRTWLKNYGDKMSHIFEKLIGAGYKVFPKYQDRIEKEAEKSFSDEKENGVQGLSSFTVNGKEYTIVDNLTRGLLKKAAGLSFTVEGGEGEELIKLLDEQQKLLERIDYVRRNYGDDGGEKALIAGGYMRVIRPRLSLMQEKIANALGLLEKPLSKSMTDLLDKTLAWRKVSEETSIPVKNAARALKDAKTKREAAEAMTTLAFACTNYIQKNDGKFFKDSDRKTLVKDILTSISSFIANNDSVYYDTFSAYKALAAYKSAEDFSATVEKKLLKKEGQKDLASALAQKKQLEKDRETLAEREYAPDRMAYKAKERFRLNVPDTYTPLYGLSVPKEEERQEEYKKLKEKTPQFTKEGYKIYEKYRNAFNYILHPEYQKIYERAKKNYKRTESGTYSREATNLLRPVNFDKDFKPLTLEDRKNHEFNLKVLRAFLNDDLEERENIIKEELPHFVDRVELPTLITKEEILSWKNEEDADKKNALKTTLKKRFDLWVEDQLKNGNAEAFADLVTKNSAIGSLQKLHPGVKDFRESNKGFNAKWDMVDYLNNYFSLSTYIKYKFRIDMGTVMVDTSEMTAHQLKNNDRQQAEIMDGLFDNIMDTMLNVYEHENDELVSYKTDEKIQREIDKRNEEKRRKKKEADEKKAAEAAREEIKKKLSESDGILFDNLNVYQSRQTKAYKDALKLHTKVKKESLSVEEKERNAKRLSQNVNAVIDSKVKLRMDTPLAVKKKVDYRTFTDLSDIAYLVGGQKELEKMINYTAEAEKELSEKKAKRKVEGRKGYEALDYMTAEILKIDASNFDISSEEAIAKNAVQLERMAHGIEAYRKMVEKFGWSEYIKYLSEKKIEGVNGNIGQMVLAQIDSLLSISRYYRIRKLIMEDEGYTQEKGAISKEVNDEDSFEAKRLKELNERSEKYALLLKEQTGTRTREFNTVFIGSSNEEYKISRLEHERYFVSPKWLSNSIKLTGDITRYQGDNPAYSSTLTTQGEHYNNEYGFKNYGTRAYMDVIEDQEKKVVGKVFGKEPKFADGKDGYLSQIQLSDSLSRMKGHLSTPLSYRRTPEELREMLDILTIQKRSEWEEIKKDPEALAFYESAFKEMAMQYLEALYANVKRVANSVGMQILVMHPADLAMQMTSRLKAELYGATVISNVGETKNLPFVKKLFEENNAERRFLFDFQDFVEMGDVVQNSIIKASNSGKFFVDVIENRIVNDELGMSQKDLEKKLFGKTGAKKEGEKIKAETIKAFEEEIARERAKGNVDPYIEKDLAKIKKIEPGYFFLKAHPEVFSIKNYCAKDANGKYLFQYNFEVNGRQPFMPESAGSIKKVLAEGKLKKPKKEVLDNYEKSLKDRNMPAYMSEKDPYGIDLVRNDLERLVKKDKDGNPVLKNGKLQFKFPNKD